MRAIFTFARQKRLDQQMLDAVERGEIGVLDQAVRDGANINAISKGSGSATLAAACNGHIAMYDHLIDKYGLSKDTANDSGGNAALLAAYNGHIAMYDHLIDKYGFSKDTVDNYGENAVLLAAYGGHTAMYDHLINKHGLSKDTVDKEGNNAASYAAYNGHIDMLKKLCEYDVDINKPNNNGKTPLQRARENDHTECAALIQQYVEEDASKTAYQANSTQTTSWTDRADSIQISWANNEANDVRSYGTFPSTPAPSNTGHGGR